MNAPAFHGQAWRTAAVMIARDESLRIAQALRSFKPWVDELVVLDTGSADDTVAIAHAEGARVASWRWCDDFALARNASLDLAGCDWHIVVDADEVLDTGGPELAALRYTPPDQVLRIRQDNTADGGTTHSSTWISRILPGCVRYRGRVHEQPVHQLPVRDAAVSIRHSGYEHDALATKAGRNERLLNAALSSAPSDPYLWFQLGKDHCVYQRWPAAWGALGQADALLRDAAQTPPWRHDLDVRAVHCASQLARWSDGMAWAESACQRWPQSPDTWFALGDLCLAWAASRPEHAARLVPLMRGAWTHCLQLGEHPEHEGAVAGRGAHLAAHNLALLNEWMPEP